MSYLNSVAFTPSLFTVSGGTVVENTTDGGVRFTPTSTSSYIEFQVNAPTLKINLTKASKGEFKVSINGRPVAIKYRFNASVEAENVFYIRTDGVATVRLQSTMTGLTDYSIELVSYQPTDVMPFVIKDLVDWKDSLINKYFLTTPQVTNIYYGRALCSLYERGWNEATVLTEIKRIADYQLLLQTAVTKRYGSSNNGIFSNGVIIDFLCRVFKVTGEAKYRQSYLDFIDYNITQGNWGKSVDFPLLFQTTDGAASIIFNHNYFMGEALILIGNEENNAQLIQIGVDQFLGSSEAITFDGHRGHGSQNPEEYKNYRYQEAFQNLRTGYTVSNQTLIDDGKKLLRCAENMTDQAPLGWILQNRELDVSGVYYEVFHENISSIALPYYYMIKNNDYDYGWEQGKKYVENAFTLYDNDLGQFWFSRNYHSDSFTPGTFHSLAWYLESGMYDDLVLNKTTGAVTFGELEPVNDWFKLRVYGTTGRVSEARATRTIESELYIAFNSEFGVLYINLVPEGDVNASGIKINTSTGIKELSKV